MSKIQTLRDDVQEKIFLRNSLDAIYKSVNSETSILTSDGKIKAELLDVSVGVANGTASGIVYNADTSRLTITNGGLQVNVQTNIGTASTTAEKAKVPTAGAVQSYISSANVIPTSAVNGLSTAITNGASTYVNSSSVIPVSAVVDLQYGLPGGKAVTENGAIASLAVGAGLELTSNLAEDNFGVEIYFATVGMKAYDTIETATTGSTVTIEPGKAYRIDATAGSKTLAISSFNAGLWGRESHLELFVANAGYIHVGNNVDLIDALEPDAVNNCTVRFHDGHAIISVEDHVGAYMVNNTSTSSSTSGTLAYGLKQTATASSYIGFRSELNTSSVPTGGATATVLKHIVGNGMDVGPTITGNLIIKSGATLRDVKLSGVTVTSGNANLTDVYIPSGATVSVGTGGSVKAERVYGDGGTLALGNAALRSVDTAGTSAYIESCTITNASSYNGIEFVRGSLVLKGCDVSGNTGQEGYLAAYTGTVSLSGCSVSSNTWNPATGRRGLCVLHNSGKMYLTDTTFTEGLTIASGTAYFGGTVKIPTDRVFPALSGTLVISSGATIDLTGNTNATTINPGGGIVVSDGCTIINSAGASVHINGGTYATIKNDGTTTA